MQPVPLRVPVREKTVSLSFRVTESQNRDFEAVCKKEGLKPGQLLQAFFDSGMEEYRSKGLERVAVRGD